MSEVRCPMCGKSNPSEQADCRYCGARLRPVWESEPPETPDPSAEDWLRSLGGEALDDADEPQVLPDWLDDLREQTDAGTALPQAETDDWLARINKSEAEPAARSSIDAPEAVSMESPETDGDDWTSDPSGELPEWLKMLVQPEAASEVSSPDFDPAADAEPFDWTSLGIEAEAGTTQSETSEIQTSEFDDSDDLSAWLASLENDRTELDASAADEVAPAASPETADDLRWLGEFHADTPDLDAEDLGWRDERQADTSSSDADDSSRPDEPQLDSTHPDAAGLSWLEVLQADYTGSAVNGLSGVGEFQPDEVKPIQGELIPAFDSLDDITEREAEEALPLSSLAADEPLDLEDLSDLPDWLSASLATDEAVTPVGDGEGAGGLNLADLPPWLQAMRPMESEIGELAGMPGSEPGPIQAAGPLAGLRGVLPAEPDISQAEKPPVYSARLTVSEAQELQVRLLTDLLEAEALTPAAPGRPLVTPQAALRWAIAALLILAVLAPLFVPQLSFQPPLPASEILAARDLINSLPANAPVLVAIDYEPGFSAEMDALSQAVLTELFGHNAVPVFVSTTATGPIQAERLIARIRDVNRQPLPYGSRYINLGFIPGGPTGLANFVLSPRRAIQIGLEGEAAWDLPALQPVDAIDRFALLLVATDSPDRARAWIEQVRSHSTDLALVMVVSAQADALVRPFYTAEPRWVQAVVSGLSGAVAYETGTAQAGAGSEYWSPFNVGLIAAATLIGLSSLINLASGRMARRKRSREDSKR